MKFTSAIIKKAWAIRKAAAAKFGCPVCEISWSLSLKTAKEAGKENEMKEFKKYPAQTGCPNCREWMLGHAATGIIGVECKCGTSGVCNPAHAATRPDFIRVIPCSWETPEEAEAKFPRA